MKVALIYPPYSSAIAPHLALPALTAFLRREGQEVVQADANLWLHRWLLTPRALEQRLGELTAEHRRLAAGPVDRPRLLNLAAWIRIIPQLAARIEESRDALGRQGDLAYGSAKRPRGPRAPCRAAQDRRDHCCCTISRLTAGPPFPPGTWCGPFARARHPILSGFDRERVHSLAAPDQA